MIVTHKDEQDSEKKIHDHEVFWNHVSSIVR